jgi:hypothetical protein
MHIKKNLKYRLNRPPKNGMYGYGLDQIFDVSGTYLPLSVQKTDTLTILIITIINLRKYFMIKFDIIFPKLSLVINYLLYYNIYINYYY